VELEAKYRLKMLLAIAGLARSTFCYHQARPARPDSDAMPKEAIRTLVTAAHGRYVHRRIHARLVQQGWRVATKTMLAVKRQLALACHVGRRRRSSSFRGEEGTVAPNRLGRDFSAMRPTSTAMGDRVADTPQ
jgi:putative transposase